MERVLDRLSGGDRRWLVAPGRRILRCPPFCPPKGVGAPDSRAADGDEAVLRGAGRAARDMAGG